MLSNVAGFLSSVWLNNIPLYITLTIKTRVAGQVWPMGLDFVNLYPKRTLLRPFPLCSFPDHSAITPSLLGNSIAFVHTSTGQSTCSLVPLDMFPPAAVIFDFRSEIKNFSVGAKIWPFGCSVSFEVT